MSTVFDVTAVTVDGGNAIAMEATIDNITITDAQTIPTVTLSVPETIDTLLVEVPGIQGPPGLQNVYVQETNPATVPGSEWGMAEQGYIWIEVNV